MLVQNFIQTLRPLVGTKSWDYIVLWKLSNEHRCIEWVDCCCAGTENIENGGEELNFSDSSPSFPCRDITFSHPRIKTCELLDQLPTSILLDSGIHSQTLLSNQASWLNFSHNSESIFSDESVGTRVLIPVSLGLLELFVTKQVPEDQEVIDFIRAQCNLFQEQQAMSNSTDSFSSYQNNTKSDPISLQQTQFSSDFSKENMDLPHEISIDRIHLCNSPLNTLQQFRDTGHTNNGVFLEETTYEPNLFNPTIENGFPDMETSQIGNLSKVSKWMEPTGIIEDQMNDDSYVCENNRSDESDPNEDEDDAKYRRRTGKGPQSKNLMAERKRRKKLNDRLYSLRALVPKISKLDRASILGDAIDYVKELEKQVKDLQIELEEHSDDEDAQQTPSNETENSTPASIIQQNGTNRGPKRQHGNVMNGFHKGSSENNMINNSKQDQELENASEKVQQMEPQVEVFQLNGNEFFVKVFCEHKSGGFVRLMDALNSLGLEVTNVTATRHTCLVSSIFKVERKNNDTVQADHVKESLLELTRNPSRMWTKVAEESVIGKNTDQEYHIHINNGEHSLLHSPQMISYNGQHLHH